MIGARGVFAALAVLALAGCQTTPNAERQFELAQATLDNHIRTLASAEYGGREPGTEGGRKTQTYLVDALESYGFVSGVADGSWRQPVELVRIRPETAELTIGNVAISGYQLVVRHDQPALAIEDSRLTVLAPGAEPPPDGSQKGRSAVMFADAIFAGEGRTMSDAGFDAIIILFGEEDTQRFGQASRSFARGSWGLSSAKPGAVPYVALSPEASAQFAQAVGHDVPSLLALAQEQEAGAFQRRTPVAISGTFAVDRTETANVIGKLPGSVPDSGAVMLLAHWDHLGMCGPEDAEDRLCNGAVDNASGIGVMLETARRIAQDGPLDRDLYVMGTTAEELGLLGAEAFAKDPPFPLPTIVAAFNMDTVAIAPRGAPATVIGWERTPLDAGIKQVTEAIGVELDVLEEHQQFVRRQDGWALLSRDVPVVLVTSSFGDEEAFSAFLNGPYHKANDEWSPDMELGGATDDIFLHIALLKHFGSTVAYPVGEE
ncbi:M28 family peptidase [Parerythrobacter jejuensis]|uniref:M28 family peptidase n=1 Tax=Parerythrobacter jejuensis TaxID=795812 RepID=A0A845ATR3_9SPHN|nr:M28 family peptidase [Parerythrobacter jejuensis]MXP32543.1 M28 family peptidase [Parerythrobacter jejuensis]